MRTEVFVGWRYLVTSKKEKFISLISVISILGITIGVMTLIVVIAVMTGFDEYLRDKIVGNYSHITISSYKGIDNKEYDNIVRKIAPNTHIKGISPYIQGQILLKEGNRFLAVGLKGIDPYTASSVTKIKEYVTTGSLDNLVQDSVIIGKELATYLGLGLSSDLVTYSPFGKERKLKVVGIFNSGMYDYDLNLIFTNLNTAQEILGLNNQFSSVAIKLDNLYLADKVRDELWEALGFDYSLKTWMDANQNFFSALKLEKLAIFIVVTMTTVVAAFGIVSTLITSVMSRIKDIGILRSVGAKTKSILEIFIFQGLSIAITGIALGLIGGISLALSLNEVVDFISHIIGKNLIPKDVYYVDRIPTNINVTDVVLIVTCALAISVLASIYPAYYASRINPSEAIRHE